MTAKHKDSFPSVRKRARHFDPLSAHAQLLWVYTKSISLSKIHCALFSLRKFRFFVGKSKNKKNIFPLFYNPFTLKYNAQKIILV